MRLNKIKGHTYYIETRLSYIPFYMLTEKDIVLLDSGLYESDAKLLEQIIEENGFNVKAIICTHAHIDHIGNNFWIQERYKAQVMMPVYESFTCSSMYNLKAYSCHPVNHHTEKRYESMICKTDKMIMPADDCVYVDGARFAIIKLYGHTFYHVGIMTPDGVFYVGDALMSCDVLKDTKIAYIADIKEDIKTKNRLRDIECDCYVIAHKNICQEIERTIDANIAYLEDRLSLMLEVIDEPMTASEVYGRVCDRLDISRRVNQYLLAEMMIQPYIADLIDNSLISIELSEGMLKYVRMRHITL